MRISDWSSDVCSSDLRPPPLLEDDRMSVEKWWWPLDKYTDTVHAAAETVRPKASFLPSRWEARRIRRLARADRKSVVEGKSVSVRVDPGGRRIIKNKKTKLPSSVRKIRKQNKP